MIRPANSELRDLVLMAAHYSRAFGRAQCHQDLRWGAGQPR
jgi:hypothetical protein